MIDLYGLGNALVDLEFTVDEDFLTRNAVDKGHMTLVDADRLSELKGSTRALNPARFSGGSAANTVFTTQALGSRCYYSCKVSDDAVGQFFLDELKATGMLTNDNALTRSEPTPSGQCLILITPDAQRSMNTFLGMSQSLGPESLDHDQLKQARYFYTEGYLVASDSAFEAASEARRATEGSDTGYALTLSDPSMVTIFGERLESLIGNGIEILFCNEEEALTFTGTDRVDLARATLTDAAHHVFITLSEKGCQYASGGEFKELPGYPVTALDSTGAGDAFAGACLHALIQGAAPADAARFGNFLAAEVVSRYGARLRNPGEYPELHKRFGS
ncbi:MAG: adenosine kinase [Pseudomonadota bacterium]